MPRRRRRRGSRAGGRHSRPPGWRWTGSSGSPLCGRGCRRPRHRADAEWRYADRRDHRQGPDRGNALRRRAVRARPFGKLRPRGRVESRGIRDSARRVSGHGPANTTCPVDASPIGRRTESGTSGGSAALRASPAWASPKQARPKCVAQVPAQRSGPKKLTPAQAARIMAFSWLCWWIVLQASTYQKTGEIGIKAARNSIKRTAFSEAPSLT